MCSKITDTYKDVEDQFNEEQVVQLKSSDNETYSNFNRSQVKKILKFY